MHVDSVSAYVASKVAYTTLAQKVLFFQSYIRSLLFPLHFTIICLSTLSYVPSACFGHGVIYIARQCLVWDINWKDLGPFYTWRGLGLLSPVLLSPWQAESYCTPCHSISETTHISHIAIWKQLVLPSYLTEKI